MLLLLLLLEWGQYIRGGCWCICVLLGKKPSHAAVDMGIAGIKATEVLPNGSKFISQ